MPSELRVGTFNLFNLVLPEVPYYGRHAYSREQFAQKQAWIIGQLQRMQADLLGFQEVFHEEALRQVVDASGLYEDAHLLTAHARGEFPAVGLLSRFPIESHAVITDFPEQLDVEGTLLPIRRFRRPVLHAELRLRPGLKVSCFVVHLKSKRPIYPEGADIDRSDPVERAKGQARALILRAAEATALRTLLMKYLRDREHPVILLGDVNDSGLAVTSRIVSGEPPFRNMPPDLKHRIWDVLLYHVKDVQARQSYHDHYYTHIHNGHYDSLDHIMVSEEWVHANPERIGRVGYVRVLNDHLVDETLSGHRVQAWQSDHGQVVATLELA